MEMAAQGKTGFDYILGNLVNLYDEGLVVLPTRLVKIKRTLIFTDFSIRLRHTLGNSCPFWNLSNIEEAASGNENSQGIHSLFGLYGGGNCFC